MQITIADIKLQANEDYTLPTAEVAKFYGVSESGIRKHLQNHSDELLEDQHYVMKINKFKKPVTYWTLEGVYMLGFFIKSERAKKYRKAVAKLLKEIKTGNVEVRKRDFSDQFEKLLNTIKEQSQQIINQKKEIDELKDKLIEQLLLNVELLKNQPAPRIKRQSWSKEEELKLIELYSCDFPLQEIAKILNRSISSIKGKIYILQEKGVIK